MPMTPGLVPSLRQTCANLGQYRILQSIMTLMSATRSITSPFSIQRGLGQRPYEFHVKQNMQVVWES